MKTFVRPVLITFAALLAAPSGSLFAQNNDTLVPGDRIRFTLTDVQSPGSWESRRMSLKGTVLEARKDSLIIQIGGDATRLAMSRAAFGDLAVSRGTERGWKTHPGRTIFEGGLTAIGAALAYQSASLHYRASSANSRSTETLQRSSLVMTGVLFTLQTSVFLQHALAKSEKWVRVR